MTAPGSVLVPRKDSQQLKFEEEVEVKSREWTGLTGGVAGLWCREAEQLE